MKISVVGCGLRTPLLLYGMAHSDLRVSEVALYDTDLRHARLMAALGRSIAKDTPVRVTTDDVFSRVVQGSSFVLSSIRVGGMEARARDERLALECGFAGQETTGPAGFAMALRTIPVALEQARAVREIAPEAWIVNFTNPAGMITQALLAETGPRVVGICDTPRELFLRISWALSAPEEELECDYFGLNHLGWIRTIRLSGEDVTNKILADERKLKSLYGVELFPPDLVRSLGLIPSEYLFFYYQPRSAIQNQISVSKTRGEELAAMNAVIWSALEEKIGVEDWEAALKIYRSYVNRRNVSYLRLEAAAESAAAMEEPDWNPFDAAAGYHRIAIDTMRALLANEPERLVLNVPNHRAITDLASEDVVELPSLVDRNGARPLPIGQLPEKVRGLVIAVKQYERLTIEAAVSGSVKTARMALFTNPLVSDWASASTFTERLISMDPYLTRMAAA